MYLDNKKYVLLIMLALFCKVSIAQKKLKANKTESLVCEVTRREYGRRWARSINEWRNSCYSLKKENEYDTIYVCIELTLWEASYRELIQVGDSIYGFTKNYNTGEYSCGIDEGLLVFYDIIRNRDINKQQKFVYSEEIGQDFLDLAPIKLITIFIQGNAYVYSSKLVYFIDAE